MAVEARHLNLFPQQLIQDRDFMNSMNQGNAYAAQQMRFQGVPYGGAALPENNLSFYQPIMCEAKTSVNTDSGLTYNNVCGSRKRSRESVNQLYANANSTFPVKNNGVSNLPSLGGDEILPQIQQYQLEIDAIISQHTKKIRLELEERQKQQARILAAAIGEGMMKKLKEKDEQIQRMGKLNLVLQERVKSLYVENQLWRDLAQTNEATANSLRTNLEQVLLRIAAEEDVESCCGSNGHSNDEQDKNECHSDAVNDRMCRRCGDREASVLLLPCRHLCLCSLCGSGSLHLKKCPICDSIMTATLHVNMSS